MVWSQFSIEILGVHFGNSVLHNTNCDKISHSLAKKVNNWNRAQLSLRWKKKRIVNQILSKIWYIGQIYTILKFIKKEIVKTIAQLYIWKCGLGNLDIDTQWNSLEVNWI